MKNNLISEQQFMQQIKELARLYGWLFYHTHDSRRSDAGWPDIALVREERFILSELKTDNGVLSPAQKDWRSALLKTPVEYYVWRPRDWPEIEKVLE